ncbi:glycosyltransferase family 39 protein [Candidatus Saccharibacteria bacterium]|nr:glycosyltransferase family 39 protein [Candidatus Saccharibacteria bacterium]
MFGLLKKKSAFLPQLSGRDYLVLFAGVLGFGALAASTVTKFSIWFDEAFGSYLIRFDYFDLTRYTAYDVHPPLYYWLLKTWSLLFGNTELGLRSMSIFFGVVTIIFVFVLIMKLFGRRAAYVTLLFLALSPLFIRYSQEARMYTVLTSIVAAATYVLVYAQENAKKRWPWVVYGLLLALGMLTQYFAALAWLSHWVWRAFVVRQEKGKFVKNFFTRKWVGAHIIAVVIFLPWLPWLIRQFADVQGNGFWIPAVSSATIPDFFTNFLLFSDHESVKSWLAAGFYIVFATLVFLTARLVVLLKAKEREYYVLLISMVLVPIIILLAMSMPPLRPAFIDRYLMASITFLPALIGVSLVIASRLYPRKVIISMGAVILAMMCVGIGVQMTIGNYNKSTHQSNNVRNILEEVRAEAPANTPIIASTPWLFYEAAIYSNANSPVYFVDGSTKYEFGSLRMLKENDSSKIKDLDAFGRSHKSFWVIANYNDTTQGKMRDNWKITKTIIVDDSVSHKPLLQAIRVTVE